MLDDTCKLSRLKVKSRALSETVTVALKPNERKCKHIPSRDPGNIAVLI